MSILKYFPYPTPRDSQKEILQFLENSWQKFDVFVIVAPTAFGKCHGRGQELIMYDGSIRKVEDVQVGDLLMGPDSRPRTVLELHRGRADMVKVTPKRGNPFIVTSNHVLPVIRYVGKECRIVHENIEARDYLNFSKTRKHCTKLWKPEDIQVPTPTTSAIMPPYILGMWLGDGSSRGPHLTTMDDDLAFVWVNWGNKLGCNVRLAIQENNKAITYCLHTAAGKNNPALDQLRELGVLNNKHIPDRYLFGSRQERMELLAGLSDTDGNWNKKGSNFEITQVRKHLAEQILFLVRSLGFAAQMDVRVIRGTQYYRVSGSTLNAQEVPVICERKVKGVSSKSNQKHTGFTVEEVGQGDYFGFETDGDHLYLLGDFTVTHNTSMSKTIMEWKHGTSYIAPTNMLVDQFLSEFPETNRLHRLDAYWCDEWEQSCAQSRARQKGFCKGCVCSADLAQAKYRKGSGVYNYHTYLAHQLFRPVLIVDEAHNLVHTIQDRLAEKIWHHDYQYPFGADNAGLLRWIRKQPIRIQKHKKIVHLREALEAEAPLHVVSHTSDSFNGKGTRKGAPEERDCLKLYPVDVSEQASMMWGSAEKIILMSATIGPKDIEALGLQQRRVVYLQAASPIPAERRPIQFVPVVSLNHENLVANIPRIVEEIRNIASYQSTEKGIIHATYELSGLLREHLATDTRFMFHDRNNKGEQYERFRNSPTSDSRVLVVSGMYEGIDLPEDLGRWQIIVRTPWKSLADPAIRHKAGLDPEWFHWESLKDLIQACGRICRTPTDFGVTYILDAAAQRLIDGAPGLIPHWFRDALDAGTK